MVVAAGRRLTFTQAAREPLCFLLSGQPAEFDAIAQATGTDAGSLAREIRRSGRRTCCIGIPSAVMFCRTRGSCPVLITGHRVPPRSAYSPGRR